MGLGRCSGGRASYGIHVVVPARGTAFESLQRSDLLVDEYYFGGRRGNSGDDPVGKLVPVGNQGGFRFRGSPRAGTVRLVALFSTGRDPDWPDVLDELSGVFTYYGDNKSPGRELHETQRGGNLLLRDVFASCYVSPARRATIPPFLLFTNTGTWRDVRFRGLLAPGSATTSPDDDLQAIWRSKSGLRFQNYRARFTVLDVPIVPRIWLDEVLAGDTSGPSCPEPWRRWVDGRAYRTLVAKPISMVRSRLDQTPTDTNGLEILRTIHGWFASRPHDFEACAVELWRMAAPSTGRVELTPPARDGGRDAVGEYLLGPASDRVGLDFVLEAKCKQLGNAVGVKEISRLISRIRHRMFGVLVTTSHIDGQAYEEVRTDRHPVVLICGRDIVDILRTHGYSQPATVRSWLAERFPGSQISPT
jgi:Restriction endonuclease AspBHI N-terminal/Restriction endonuclease